MAYGVAREAFEYHGNISVKLSFYLEPSDYGYDKTYVDVTNFTGATYPGRVNKNGVPRDPSDYDAWVASLPTVKQLNPFHNHLIYLPPDYTDKDVEAEIAFHLPNFYKAWCDGKTMRSGWAVEKRIRPTRFDIVSPETYAAKKSACLAKIEGLTLISLAVDAEGKTYPATTIDVGYAATNRASSGSTNNYTHVSKGNTANDTGVLDTVEVFLASGSSSSTKIGVASGSPNTFTCNDYASVGSVTGGSKATFTGLSIDVETGNYIALYCNGGSLEIDTTGGSGHSYKAGDQFGAGSQSFTSASTTSQISLYGSGETVGVAYIKISNETEQVSEAIQRAMRLKRDSADTVQLTETSQISRGLRHVIAETVSLAESIVASVAAIAGDLTQVVNETIELIHSAVAARAMHRTSGEHVELTETASRHKSMWLVVADTLNITEAIIRIRGIAVTVAETIEISEIVNTARGWVHVIAETIETSEAVQKCMTLVKHISETIEIAESYINARARLAIVSDLVEIGEGLVDILITNVLQVVTETVAIVESAVRQWGLRVVVALNLFPRLVAKLLWRRRTSFNLQPRSTSFTLEANRSSLVLAPRTSSFTLPHRDTKAV